MRSFRLLGIAILAVACASVVAQRVAVKGSGGWGASAPFNALYNQNTVVQFEGKVIGVERSAPMPGMEVSVAALVKSSNGGTSTVDLGPAWYVDNQSVKVKIGDRITVTGSKVFKDGRSMILAQKFVARNTVTYLRSMDGFPMWVAWRGHIDVASNNSAHSNTVVDPNAGIVDAGDTTVLTGPIYDIIEVPVGLEGTPSVILLVGNANAYNSVYLGPTWYMNRQDMFLNVGDNVTIRGEVNGERRLRDPRILGAGNGSRVGGDNGVVITGNNDSRVGGEVNGERRQRDPRILAPGPRRFPTEINGERRLRDPRILATQVQRGNQIMRLRNSAGLPVWSGGRR